MAVDPPPLKERILPDDEEAVRRLRRDASRLRALLLPRHGDGGLAEHAHAVHRAVPAKRNAQLCQVARTDEQAADSQAVMRVRVRRCLIGLAQQIAGRHIQRAVLFIGGGDVLRALQLRDGVGRVDAQRRKDGLAHVAGDVLSGHRLDDGAGDARAEVAVLINRAGAHVLEVGARLLRDVDHLPQRAGAVGIGGILVQPRRVGHELAQRDGIVRIARIAHGVAQIGADVLVGIEHALLHQLQEADARHQLRHGRNPEIGMLRHGHMRRLLLFAVVAFIDDLLPHGDDHRPADRLRAREGRVHRRIHIRILRQRRAQRQKYKRQKQRSPSVFHRHPPVSGMSPHMIPPADAPGKRNPRVVTVFFTL